MNLGLDVLDETEEHYHIALSHYYRHPSGDMIADPDTELLVHRKARMAEALTYQDSFGYRVVYHDQKRTRVDLRAKRELNSFLRDWLSNLLDQGHK